MRGYDPKRARPAELFQHGFGNSPAQAGLGTGAEFINQHQALFTRQQQELLHGQQMRRVGREVVFDALLVADIQENILEYTSFRFVATRDE